VVELAVIGFVEAVVYLLRYRSANHPSHWWSAFTTTLIASMRILFVMYGAKVAIESDNWFGPAAAYVVSATVTTAALHWWLERRKAKEGE